MNPGGLPALPSPSRCQFQRSKGALPRDMPFAVSLMHKGPRTTKPSQYKAVRSLDGAPGERIGLTSEPQPTALRHVWARERGGSHIVWLLGVENISIPNSITVQLPCLSLAPHSTTASGVGEEGSESG